MGYPHSVLDVLPAQGSEGILQGIFRSAPTKILFAGTDFLLTSSFRGGLGGLRAGSVLCAGPRPLSNSNLRLVQSSGEGQLPFQPVEVIKGDSQKADDAAVPDQLWLHAFLVGYGDPQCQARHRAALGVGGASTRGTTEGDVPPPGWQVSMTGFRSFGLRFWRRRAVRGYFNWRRNNVPWQSNLATPAQMVRWRMGMVFGSVRPVYEWSAKGRLSYNKQWALLRGTEEGSATVEAGFDAIRWCANSSWFEWLEGSAPLFWNWPQKYQKDVRDGQPHFWQDRLVLRTYDPSPSTRIRPNRS